MGIWSVIFLFGYPIIVYLIGSITTKKRVAHLESTLNATELIVETLEGRVSTLRKELGTLKPPAQAAAPAPAPAPEPVQVIAVPPPAPAPAPKPAPVPEPAQSANPMAASVQSVSSIGVPVSPHVAPPQDVDPTPAWLVAAKNWLFSGNIVAKIGLLILFIGVSFMLKYAAEQYTLPIELRLAGIVMADLALLLWGWRVRLARREVGLPIQGAALAILMLVTFGAFRLYHLIPGGLAFALLLVLTAATCLLAVLQDALWLAVFGIAGGFAAPILTSTGAGSHIALFSYYALLNAGIFAIAIKRTWRILNLLGFVFTFLIGTAWGVLKYVPENYLSAQAFLILFFAFYVAIALAYAARQATQLKHYVDATLVFGTPLLAFGLQYGLVKERAFGLAFSALALGLFYSILALALWRRRGTRFQVLTVSFLALGVVFGSLALPFALDGRWTSAAWAVEGAGVVWVGLRQRQRLTWAFGLLIQTGAWIAFIGAISGLDKDAALHANLWLGFLLLAAAAFAMATNFRSQGEDAGTARFAAAANAFLAFATLWLLAGAWTEIFLRSSGTAQANLLVISALLTAGLLSVLARRMQWALASHYALATQLLGGAALLLLAVTAWDWSSATPDLFAKPVLGALLIGASAMFSSWTFQRQAADRHGRQIAAMLLAWSAFWYFGPVLHTIAGWLEEHYLLAFEGAHSAIQVQLYEICAAAAALGFAWLAQRLAWNQLRWLSVSCWVLLALATCDMLRVLYGDDRLPVMEYWAGYAALWCGGELLLRFWPARAWPIGATALNILHAVRSAGPWLMVWPTGAILCTEWLEGPAASRALLARAFWRTSGSWANYLPAWLMMLAVMWLIRRARHEQWPTVPVAAWYRQVLIPIATLWALLLVVAWNLQQDGAMEPLPYLPLLNPLDLSSAFALLMGTVCYRMLRAERALPSAIERFLARLPLAGGLAAYAWLNLVLLRSASHYLAIPYHAGTLYASQFVQAMLSLVWSVTALLLMRWAANRTDRKQWILGACLLGLVVAKLVLVDLSNVGSLARIVSFVGAGLLMVLIGYLAPYPTQAEQAAQPVTA